MFSNATPKFNLAGQFKSFNLPFSKFGIEGRFDNNYLHLCGYTSCVKLKHFIEVLAREGHSIS